MPLYEYECDVCAHRFEVIQKYSDAVIDVCPKCAGTVKKLLSSPAIQFKGSGFYITDYARSGRNDSGKGAGQSDAPGGSSASESKAETKTEAPAAATASKATD